MGRSATTTRDVDRARPALDPRRGHALLIAAQLARIPYPILLVLGGLGLAVTPGIPEVELDPELVLLIILPPLLYAAAFFTPLRELRRNVRAISMLAVGLVLATMVAVAAVAHEALGFGWAEAFVLGAIVSPTDPVAATAIAAPARRPGTDRDDRRGREPDQRRAPPWSPTSSPSPPSSPAASACSRRAASSCSRVDRRDRRRDRSRRLVAAVRRRLDNPPVEVTIALFTAYFAYLPAEAIGVSGVLAAVTVGIYMGRLTSRLTTPTTRIQGIAVWEIVTFLLNSALFVLVGLQLPTVIDGIDGIGRRELIAEGALIAATVIVVADRSGSSRSPICRGGSRPRVRAARARPPWRNTLLVAWTGMRGAVSLAAALALPLTIDAGGAFPERDLIIFLAFSVILVTLLLQGLTLPPLIKLLGVDDDDEELELEEIEARLRAAEAALERARRAGRRGVGARRHGRAGPRRLPLPPAAVRRALSRDGEFDGGMDGDGIDYETRSRRLPAPGPRADRGPARDR